MLHSLSQPVKTKTKTKTYTQAFHSAKFRGDRSTVVLYANQEQPLDAHMYKELQEGVHLVATADPKGLKVSVKYDQVVVILDPLAAVLAHEWSPDGSGNDANTVHVRLERMICKLSLQFDVNSYFVTTSTYSADYDEPMNSENVGRANIITYTPPKPIE